MTFTIIQAKIADDWDHIPGKGNQICFRQERRLKRGDQDVPEPAYVQVFWTPQGGLKRANDLSLGPHK